MNRQRWWVLGVLLIYWGVSLTNLTVTPPVHEDEPWLASTGWKLAQTGVFGSDMFAGYHGMERNYYDFMPLYPMWLAVAFKGLGLGLFQDRLATVALGSLILSLTYALGKRLFRSPVGLLAIALLIAVRSTAVTPVHISGILLIDLARIARYDMLVPVFGLTALHAYLSAQARARYALYGVAGLLAGLAGLSHVYGAFWIGVLLFLAAWNRSGWRSLAALIGGFSVPWLIYSGYILSNVPDWIGQTRDYAPRFDVLNLQWYVDNVRREWLRYAPDLGPIDWTWLTRPGWWLSITALPLAMMGLLRRVWRERDRQARTIVTPALLFPGLFALLIYSKVNSYLMIVTPIWAVAVAWLIGVMWQRATLQRSQWFKRVMIALLLLVAIEGALSVMHVEVSAAQTTPYANFVAQVRAAIPPGSRVLGLHRYWFGLSDFDYHSWYVPLIRAQSGEAIEPILSDLAPDVVLMDSRLGVGSDGTLMSNSRLRPVFDWLAQKKYAQIAVVDDATYGSMLIYQRIASQ
jgi:4-amino-4-deoxy-L-arabinose transferase-like glycosyltransferase